MPINIKKLLSGLSIYGFRLFGKMPGNLSALW
jgi:hypothetical protein